MRQTKPSPAALLALLLSLLIAGLSTAAPARSAPDAPRLPEEAMPPLTGGVPAAPPITAVEPPAPQLPAAADAPAITVWYGLSQRAGHRGDPQKWFNVLGNVASAAPLAGLAYTLNGGPARPLSVGPDTMRLARPGDFNIELDYTDLLPGPNAVAITATDTAGGAASVTVTVNYESGLAWPAQTYTYDWASAGRVEDLAQIVDGQWTLNGGGVRPTVFDFDRLLALGDLAWRDYTVTVPVTIYGIDPEGYKAPSNGPGVGLLVRWQGHYDAGNGVQPLTGWRRLGALAWYRWQKDGDVYTEGLQMVAGQGRILGTAARKLTTGTTYVFKVAIASSPAPGEPATYRFKVWNQDQPEPAAWDIERRGIAGEPSGGSFLLVAHHVDVRFGAVRVDLASSRPSPTLTVTQAGPGAGSVVLSPTGPAYRFGEDVTATAVPGLAATFGGWTGSVTSPANPLPLTLFESAALAATFNSGGGGIALPLILSSSGSGAAGGVGFAPADVLRFDGETCAMHFDGSAVAATRNVTALARDGDSLLLVFAANQPTPAGTFTPWDVARFTPATPGDFSRGGFSPVLRGKSVGLTTSGEKIDALDALAGGRLLISTAGSAAVPGPGGAVLKAQDEDALAYDPATGVWSPGLDATGIPGMAVEDVNGLWRDEATGDTYVSIQGGFSVGRPAIRGNGRTVLRLSPDPAAPGGLAVSLAWDAAAAGLPAAIDGIDGDEG